MSVLEVVVYQDADGNQPFTKWHDELDAQAVVKIDTAVRRMAEGNLSDSKSVGAGVMERRLDWGPGYRIYFGRDGNRIVVLLGGGTKKLQQSDIAAALERWSDYKQRRAQEK